jgi:hypothetical protein
MRLYILLVSTLLGMVSCNNNSTVVEPPNQQADTRIVIRDVVPRRGRMSDTVNVYGFHFQGARIAFNGLETSYLWRSDTILSARVPRGATSGRVILFTLGDTAIGPVFTVDSVCSQNLCIVPYYGSLLTEQQSWQKDWFYRYVEWAGQVRADSIILTQGPYQVGDDTRLTRLVRFTNNRGPTALPTSVDAILVHHEMFRTVIDTLKGIVAIQSWDTAGVVSGKISWFYEPYKWWYDFVFWYDFGR